MDSRVIIIAEAGVNHNGDMENAKKLIDAAVDAGVDYVKFQSFVADKLVSKEAKKAEYQKKNIGDGDDSQYQMLKRLELSHQDHLMLIEYCNSKGIKFLSTAFDVEGVEYLYDLGLKLYKVPSGELTNYPYLRAIAQKDLPIILSTGMATSEDIESALSVLLKYGASKEQITILHCNTEYPTPMEDVNLLAMLDINESFGVNVGYSDHTLGIEVPTAAVALGGTIIEKHFTLDRTMPGPDHAASLEPEELKAMVSSIRNIEKAISGSGKKEPSLSERKNIAIARKSIHLKRDVPTGTVISEEDLIALRPGDGISPMEWNNIIGKEMLVDKKAFDQLKREDFK